MTIHFTHKSGGPCWSRERGYHQPPKLPDHIMRSITQRHDHPVSSESAAPKAKAERTAEQQANNLLELGNRPSKAGR